MTSGIIVIDKPAGITSRRCLDKVIKKMGFPKAGYVGTLDPFATGLLPVCFGKATKIIPFIQTQPKKYVAGLKLGLETDSWDITGKVLKEETDLNLIPFDNIKNTLNSMVGVQNQLTPVFSARKIKGVRMYKLARERCVAIPEKRKKITIFDIKLLRYEHPEIFFETTCSSGTYIRTLGRDIAQKLGTIGTLMFLRRVEMAGLTENDAVTLETLERMKNEYLMNKYVLSVEKGLSFLPKAVIKEEFQTLFLNGNRTKIENYKFFPDQIRRDTEIRVFSEKGDFLGIIECFRKMSKVSLKTVRIIDIKGVGQ